MAGVETTRELQWRGAPYRLTLEPSGRSQDSVLTVLADGQSVARLDLDLSSLERLSRAQLGALVERALKAAAVERWESEGGNPASFDERPS